MNAAVSSSDSLPRLRGRDKGGEFPRGILFAFFYPEPHHAQPSRSFPR